MSDAETECTILKSAIIRHVGVTGERLVELLQWAISHYKEGDPIELPSIEAASKWILIRRNFKNYGGYWILHPIDAFFRLFIGNQDYASVNYGLRAYWNSKHHHPSLRDLEMMVERIEYYERNGTDLSEEILNEQQLHSYPRRGNR